MGTENFSGMLTWLLNWSPLAGIIALSGADRCVKGRPDEGAGVTMSSVLKEVLVNGAK